MNPHIREPDWLPIDTAPHNRRIEVRGRIDETALTERVYLVTWSNRNGVWLTRRGDAIIATAWRNP